MGIEMIVNEFFLENPSEEMSEETSEAEESSTVEAKTEEKKNSEYEYTLYPDHVIIKNTLAHHQPLIFQTRLMASQ